MPLARGTRLGPYEVLAPLGAGGMGEVWRARDTKLARDVALKVLPDHLSDDPKALARFENEAKAVAALSHPHILAIHDFGRIDGVSYVVTELLEGETLRATLLRGPLPLRKALDIAAQLADALAAAHEKEIVHRDVKPENVILTKDGRAKLLDFGLAHHDTAFRSGNDTHSPTVSRNTDPGTILGTVSYMSPEQAQGHPAGYCSDQFSLGVVLYEMLSGKRPFHGPSSAETLAAIIRTEPEPLGNLAPSTPTPVRWIVDRLLSKDPTDRYDSTRDLARDLATCRQHLSEATTSSTSALPARGAPALGRRKVWLPVAALALACTLSAGYWLGAVRSRPKPEPPAPFPKLVQLTWEAGREMSPSFSPDGGSFVYVAGSHLQSDIFLRRVGGESATNLTSSIPGYALEPAFSPDGQSIAFRSERDDGGIFVMGATGESPRRLTDAGFSPRWSPDGREIAYATQPGVGASSHSELWIVEVATGAKRKLYDGNGVSPTWSPSGRRIAFHQKPTGDELAGRRSLSTIPVAGGTPSVVLEIPGTLGSQPDWSRTGIAFVSTAGGVPNVWRVRVDESTGKRIGNEEPILTSQYSTHPSFTPDGRRLACSFFSRSFTLERVLFDSERGKVLSQPKEILAGPRVMRLAAVAPNGEWLGMILFEHDGQKDILLVRTESGETRRLTNDWLNEDNLVWAPDASRLFFAVPMGGVSETWSIRPDGSGRELEVPRAGAESVVPAWMSPDARTLYVSVGKDLRLHTVDLGLPKERRVPVAVPTPETGGQFEPSAGSRDGNWLIGYPTNVPGGVLRPLLLFDVRNKRYETLVDLEWNWPCVFLPDSRRILLSKPVQIEILDRVTHTLTPAGSISPGTMDIGFSADGRSLFTTRAANQSDIWMLDYGKTR